MSKQTWVYQLWLCEKDWSHGSFEIECSITNGWIQLFYVDPTDGISIQFWRVMSKYVFYGRQHVLSIAVRTMHYKELRLLTKSHPLDEWVSYNRYPHIYAVHTSVFCSCNSIIHSVHLSSCMSSHTSLTKLQRIMCRMEAQTRLFSFAFVQIMSKFITAVTK